MILVDTSAEARERAVAAIGAGLDKLVERGRLSADDAAAARGRLVTSGEISDLAEADLVIEAIPEIVELKQEVLSQVAAVVRPDAVLATNTSSLSVSAIASGIVGPERVLGMHFFNPPPVMRLLEVVPGDRTDEASLETATAFGKAMGKETILAADGPGFIVNRCGRPFNLEAQRLIQHGIADAETIDRLCREAAGFRMGPLELLDLVGLDVGINVSQSFYDQSFYEPRWQPSTILARLVAAGRLGRKSGRGFYSYPRQEAAQSPGAVAPESMPGAVDIIGDTPLAGRLRELAGNAGWRLDAPDADLVVDAGARATDPTGDVPRLTFCVQSLAVRDPEAVGFVAMLPIAEGAAIELTRTPRTREGSVEAAEGFVQSLGLRPVWVGDAPGLVVGRIISQLINEAAFGSAAGVGTRADIDTGMRLGLNYPRGPFEWLSIIGVETVVGILDALHTEYAEEKYRVSPLLRAAERFGVLPEERRVAI